MESNRHYLLTSESVTEGHPDKIADQVSDAVLDAIMADDPNGRVACETMVTTGLAIVAGEITTNAYVDIPSIVRQTIREIGYTRAKYGFDFETCGVITSIDEQSSDIAMGVDPGGAGDQGLMFGYASTETPELMPLPIMLAHKLCQRLAEVRKEDVLDYVRPDGKAQVTVEYQAGKPARVDTVVVSTQHGDEVSNSVIREDILEKVVAPVVGEEWRDDATKYHINPTGRFVTGGPQGDCGLTGRKIIVDTYGGVGSHGGGAFSGKDCTKVDRTASYMARYICKNLVAAGVADRLELQLAYAIGVADPVSIMVHSRGTARVDEDRIVAAIREIFPLSPKGMIEHLDLRRPIYRETAAYGHFGREQFPWESTKLADDVRRFLDLSEADMPQTTGA
jgi:S-adenosylmethionine synthetase